MSSLSGAEFESSVPAASPREKEVLRKARDGDRSAFGQIVGWYQDRLYNAILRMVGDPEDARELTQEAFTRALDRLETFRGESGPYTWLFRIAMNLAISRLRQDQRRRTFSLDAGTGGNGKYRDTSGQASSLMDRVAADAKESPSARLERRERDQQVLAAMGRIDADYRAVLIMRDVEGFDYQQMADVLGLPLGTLKSRLFRARVALRDELLPYMTDQAQPRS
jgi:RNA polymerase sigma-70 factor (ECF subfamily)